MAKPYTHYVPGDVVWITTPSRLTLAVKLTEPVKKSRHCEGAWSVIGHTKTKAMKDFAPSPRRWIADTISPAHFA